MCEWRVETAVITDNVNTVSRNKLFLYEMRMDKTTPSVIFRLQGTHLGLNSAMVAWG